MNHFAAAEKQNLLRNSLDTIVQHVTNKLPHGYQLRLLFTRGEYKHVILTPDGEVVTHADLDFYQSHIDQMCVIAIQHAEAAAQAANLEPASEPPAPVAQPETKPDEPSQEVAG